MSKNKQHMQWVLEELLNCAEPEFFGKVLVTFQNGKVVDIRVEKVIKPPNFNQK